MTSTIKVNNIQNQCGQNIINENSNTITLGASGDTIALASGASQTGFGRTGTVDWQTGSIKTATFTAANGEGYFADTSSTAFTMNLPSGTAGAIVSVVDYTNTFQTNNLTVTPNGSQKIGGVAASQALSTEGQSITLVYVDDTEGWKNVQDSTSNVVGNPFISATGGTITTSGNCKIHTFTGPGTFTVSAASQTAAENVVSYLVVAGGGSGGINYGGGGGAGGFREVKSPITPYTASPLDGYPSSPNRVTITAQAYPIAVGGGGAASPGFYNPGGTGSVSTFSSITSAGGGGGAGAPSGNATTNGVAGGSGGGGSRSGTGGAGNTPPTTPSQGNRGGNSEGNSSSGGGAGSVGTGGNSDTGGSGVATQINPAQGSPATNFAGGGGAAGAPTQGGPGGGGGNNPSEPGAGTANTGGGGAGNQTAAGGSGIVIIRYKFQ
jgi:hypothetical protein